MSREVYGLAGAELRVVDGNLQLTFGVAPAAMRALTARLWRATPPTIDEVKVYAWWWNKPADGSPPHILQLDVDDNKVVIVTAASPSHHDGDVFDPADWPGEWAPAEPPP